jgi:hypothetical protein
MVGILVGNRFEEIIHTRYPWLKRMKNGNNAADFRVELFDLELKAGLAESGVEPHKYQLEQLTQNRRVAYVCGFAGII